MNNGFYYQLLSGLARENNRFNYPRVLRELVRTGELDEVKKVEDALKSEIAECSLQNASGAEYFVHLAEHGLLFALYRENKEGFEELADLVEKRLHLLRGTGGNFPDVESWLWYVGYLRVASNRLLRNITIEQFELEIDNIEWEELTPALISKVSGITGFVYLNEEIREKFNKSRFWLQQAVAASDISSGLVYYMNLADYFLSDTTGDAIKQIEGHIKTLENTANSTHDPNLSRVYRAAVLELQARALLFRNADADDDHIRVEESLRAVRELEKNIDYDGKNSPAFVRAFLKLAFSNYYLGLSKADLDREDIEDLLAMSMDGINEALSISRRMRDESLRRYLSVEWLRVASARGGKGRASEKDFKEILSLARKSDNYPALVRATKYFSQYYRNIGQGQRAYDVLADMQKRGYKRLEEGGFFLVLKAFEDINDLMNHETRLPGVSWVVGELENYFQSISDIMDDMENNLDRLGFSLFKSFREQYIAFEPVSHFNLKVFLRYQYNEIKLLRLSAIVSQDDGAQTIATRLMKEVGHDNSPFNFMLGNWEEFKNVPNSVRNKVLNKCISISKGDLPLAAEHLDFSYRNLRSYITFKEVNRLGFFLDEKDTKVRQLEQGIRLMFFDLYKRGTIFEVVFDMPKFLVDHSKGGFSSQDLEEALDIKGTTAKKYIKIMMEIGLIKLERSVGRKHFYKLRKDNVMNRLGQDQKVLAAALD